MQRVQATLGSGKGMALGKVLRPEPLLAPSPWGSGKSHQTCCLAQAVGTFSSPKNSCSPSLCNLFSYCISSDHICLVETDPSSHHWPCQLIFTTLLLLALLAIDNLLSPPPRYLFWSLVCKDQVGSTGNLIWIIRKPTCKGTKWISDV